MNVRPLFFISLLGASLLPQTGGAGELPTEIRREIGRFLDATARKEISVGRIDIDSVAIEGNTLQLFANMNCAYIPFREDNVAQIYRGVSSLLPAEFAKYKLQIRTNKRSIEELIPQALRKKKDKKTKTFRHAATKPLVTDISTPYIPTNGLHNRHIALWQSHGYYYEPKLARWEWQRARIFQTVEDLYTQSYVLPFLVPMLENAGANVLLPRERDCQTAEIIIDNDGSPDSRSIYTENAAGKRWTQGNGKGFAHLRSQYINFENPFKEGTYRSIETIRKGKESTAEWIPEIPAAGRYAIYVSYQTLPNSTDDALYTVYHKGGVTQFKVNQQMGGGTWIYLGTFGFDAGKGNGHKVTLSNRSAKAGQTVTADAVKIGGGMGNIARRISDAGTKTDYPYETSAYPRFCEAARYWLQWAGIPDSIYSESRGKNDYTDDYKCRGLWVNYLAGGSAANPADKGLNIPVDMAFAFHSDAGTTLNDSIIGTLGIYCTNAYNEMFANGASRYLSHDLTDLIQSNIVRDIRSLYEPRWTRRGMWNQSYYEARVPRVPTMLLELLSHQNFADMRYGLDPRFRFTVSRAIYKGMLQFLCSQHNMDYAVQPLPVDHMSLRMIGEDEVELTWQPVPDPLEPTATAEKYIVYTRIGDGDFDNGILVDKNSYRTALPSGMVCSYKVTAVNKGGESFPSEILSAGRAVNAKGTVLVINGFDRISAPADFVAPAPADTLLAGFLDDVDHGVPYVKDISYIGKMKEFRRSVPWMDDDASGFGDSYGNYENRIIAGNTFDYPAIHGAAILKAGYSFVSGSDEAVEDGQVSLNDYKYTDLILGKECQTKMGRGGAVPLEFKTFSKPMQKAVTAYCNRGGNIFVSGAYVGTDLWDNRLADAEEADKEFATGVLKYKWRAGQAATTGKVKCVASPFTALAGDYSYHNELNPDSYAVESPDAIEPSDKEAYTIMRYSENNLSAGVAYSGAYKTCVLGFPFESVRSESEREALMGAVLNFFNENRDNHPQVFRFAQLTDLHLSPYNPNPTEDLLRSVAQINATDSIDFVLVTGDLTEEGDRATMKKVKSCLDLLKVPYYTVLGNHETKWSDSGCTAFGEIFGSERFEFEHKGILFLGFNSGPLMRMAYGHVVPQDIRWMTEKMEKAGKDKPVILVTHYPLTEGDVDNWYEVTDAVRPYNVRLFIGGHYHSNRNLCYDGIPGILMRSNLRDKEGKPGYGIYEVADDSIRVYVRRIGEPGEQWAAFSLTKPYYDHGGRAEKYPDFSVNNEFPEVKEQWIVQTGAGIYCSPAVYGDKVFVGDDMGRLTAYALKSGKQQWSFGTGRRIVGTPAASQGIVVFGSADRNIYGLDARNGNLLWKVEAAEPVLGATTIVDGIAYIGASDHVFRAINIHTGKVIWACAGIRGYIETKPLVTEDKVIFGAWDNTLYALNKTDGKELWRWTGGLTRMHFSPAAVWPVAANGKVFITDPQRAMTAIDIKTGDTVWRTFRSAVRETIGLSEDGERVYSKTMNDSIVCYSAMEDTPQELWASDVGFGYEHAPSMQVEKGGVMFGSTKEGLIFALEGKTGKVLWKHKTGNSLISTVVPLNRQEILFTATSGEVGLLRANQ